MNRETLDRKELYLAHELAELYYQMDKDPRTICNVDIERLYGAAARNPNIHYKALEINNTRHKKRKGEMGRGDWYSR